MFFGYKRLKLIALMCIVISFKTTFSFSENYSMSLGLLAKHMKGKGIDIIPLFSHPEFMIYEDVDEYFKKSAESKGIDPYIKAIKKGDMKEAERVLKIEYEKYKDTIGFYNKKENISSFIERYNDRLSFSEKKYNIPKEVIASIIGLESHFGHITGKYFAFNVYVSMYVKNYRKEFALSQLEELCNFAHKKNRDIFEFNSSYAGAIGPMQFLPWSLNRWFIGDDVFDMDDSIISVANYLSHFKKKRWSLERAIFAYNPSKLYYKAVVELAEYKKE